MSVLKRLIDGESRSQWEQFDFDWDVGVLKAVTSRRTTQYSPNSTWLDSTRHDSTRSTCRAHAFWLCRASQRAQLDSLDTTSSTGSTRRTRLARHVELDRRYLQLSYDHRNSFIV